MPTLTVITRENEEKQIDDNSGLSVMKVVRGGGIDEVAALCGGLIGHAPLRAMARRPGRPVSIET